MTLRSVDMQVLLPKVAEVNRNQPVQNQQDQTHQQQFAAQLEKQTELQRQQVQDSHKSEGGKIDRQAKDRRQETGGQSGRRDREKKGEAGVDVKEPGKGDLLDIKI